MNVPIARPDIGDEEIHAVTEVLRGGMLAAGKQVAELEDRWASTVGVRHAIAVSNGTVAAMCVYAGLGLGAGDEVITVGHTFNATVSSIMSVGARPVFVDVESDTYVIDDSLVEAAITPRTRAISPVHLFGLPARMDRIMAIASRHGLTVVEDACQAHGATFEGRVVGSFGHGVFSLYATKNITSGEGGLITTDDDRLADWLRLYRNQGMRERYHHEILGYNFRMTDVAAAIANCQLDKLERNTAHRRHVAARYDEGLADLSVRLPFQPDDRTHVYHQYTIDVGQDRDVIAEQIRSQGVGVGLYYPVPVHRQPYVGDGQPTLPTTERLAATTLSLPIYPTLTNAEIDHVIASVRSAVSMAASA